MHPCLWQQEGGPTKGAYPWVSTSSSLHNHSLLFLTPLFFPPFLWPTYEPQHRGHRDKSLSPSGSELTCYCSLGSCSLQGTQPSAPLTPKFGRPGASRAPLGTRHSLSAIGRGAPQSPWDFQLLRPHWASPVWIA